VNGFNVVLSATYSYVCQSC